MTDAQKTIAEFAARLAAKGAAQDAAAQKAAAQKAGAQKGGEEKIVIRPAGAAPTGVRVSASSQAPAAASQAVARSGAPSSAPATRNAARPLGKGKAKGGKPRKAASPPRRPMMEVLRGWTQDFRFRLLPVTIFVAVLMLGVRVGDMWRIATRDAKLPDFPVTMAQGPQTPPPANGAKAPADKAPPPKATTAPTSAPTPAKDGPPPMANGAASTPAANAPLGPISDQELLQHFAERRAEIEKRTKEIEQREALLTAAEKRIDQKVSEMEKVRSDIQKLMSQGDEKQSAQLESLVKIYETMKPKEAARIFEELEMPVLLGVIQKMKENKSAPILASMDPVKAKEVTSALIERRVPITAK